MFENFENPNKQDNVGMCYAMAYYSKLGWTISIPITDTQDYDLVVDNGEKLLKIQVKTTKWIDNGKYQVGLRTTSGNKTVTKRKDFSENHCDILFVLTDCGECYSIPRDQITSTAQLTLGDKYFQYKVNLI